MKNTPIVGIGASAGGLKEFEQFFKNMPSTTEVAFVIIQHLSPNHKSILADIVNRYTEMDVCQIENNMAVNAGKVYIIPPNNLVLLKNDKLQLKKMSNKHGLNLPIDVFFRSMKDNNAEQSVAVILSGTGSDGTLGIKEVKEAGGLTIVQQPDTAVYDGMPASAIRTGLIDYIIPVDEMPNVILSYIQNEFQENRSISINDKSKEQVKQIVDLIKNRLNHDFANYNCNTIFRILERRLTLNKLDKLSDYIELLKKDRDEVILLFKELFITCTESNKKIESDHKIKESEEKYRITFENSPDSIIIHDSDMNVIDVNLKAMKEFGYSKREFLQLKVFDLHTKDKLPHSKEMLEEMKKQEKLKVDTKFRRKDDSIFWAEASSCKYALNGEPIIHVVIRNNTELVETKDELIKHQNHLEELVEEKSSELKESEEILKRTEKITHIGSWDWDIKTDTIRWSDELFRIFNLNKEKGVPGFHKGHANLYTENSWKQLGECIKKAIEKGESYEIELEFVKNNSETGILKSFGFPQRNKNGKVEKLFGSVQDITEQKKAEQDLIRNQHYLQKSQEIGKIGTWHLDLENNLLTWTKENYKIFGIKQNTSMNYELFAKCIHPDDRAYVDQEWKKGIENNSYDIEHRLIVNGEVKWVREKAEFIFRDDGEVTSAIGVTEDISDRKKLEDTLREKHKYLKKLNNSLESVVFNVNIETRLIEYVNNRVKAVFGYSPDECIGNPTSFLYPNNEAFLDYGKQMQKAVRNNHEFLKIENTLKRKSGELFNTEITTTFLSNTEVVAVITDITERKKAEQALKDSELKFKSIIENSTNLFYKHDVNHNITYLSPQAKDILGYTVEEAMRLWTDFVTDNPVNEEGYEKTMAAIETGKKQEPYVMELKHKKGHCIWVEVREAPVVKNGKTTDIVGVLVDITERVKFEQELKIKADELDKLNKDKDDFISILAHDLKNPINGMVNLSLLLLNKFDRFEKEMLKKQIGVINDAAKKTYQLLHNTLLWANPETNILDSKPSHFKVLKAIEDEIQLLMPLASEKNIHINNNVKNDIDIHMNVAIIKTVIRNLVNNAIKFTPKKGTISIDAQNKERELIINVKDTGVGIAQSEIDKLFVISHIKTTEGTQQEKGTGFGLRICHKLLRSVGGKIHVESEVGKGTTFSFTIPLNNEKA